MQCIRKKPEKSFWSFRRVKIDDLQDKNIFCIEDLSTRTKKNHLDHAEIALRRAPL